MWNSESYGSSKESRSDSEANRSSDSIEREADKAKIVQQTVDNCATHYNSVSSYLTCQSTPDKPGIYKICVLLIENIRNMSVKFHRNICMLLHKAV